MSPLLYLTYPSRLARKSAPSACGVGYSPRRRIALDWQQGRESGEEEQVRCGRGGKTSVGAHEGDGGREVLMSGLSSWMNTRSSPMGVFVEVNWSSRSLFRKTKCTSYSISLLTDGLRRLERDAQSLSQAQLFEQRMSKRFIAPP